MSLSERLLLDDHGVRVTDRQLVVDGVTHTLYSVRAVRVASEASYRGKTVPFAVAVACVLWALTEVVNAPADYVTAGFAFALALLCMFVLRVVGSRQTHVVMLSTPSGEHAVMRSKDGVKVSAVVKAVREALADRQSYRANAWHVGQAARG